MKLDTKSVQRIVIIGMGRSGTTFLTQFLGECGIYLDEVNWAFEHELGRLVNDTLLAQQFGAGPGLPYGKLPRDKLRIRDLDYWKRMASFYINYMDARTMVNGVARSWAFKDPRTTILHALWLEHFDVIIGMYRPPEEVIASYLSQKWITGFNKKRIAMDYWKTFNVVILDVHRQCQGKKPVYILEYDESVERQSNWLCEKLGIDVTPQARALFRKELKHHRSSGLPRDAEAREIYDALQAISVGKL